MELIKIVNKHAVKNFFLKPVVQLSLLKRSQRRNTIIQKIWLSNNDNNKIKQSAEFRKEIKEK